MKELKLKIINCEWHRNGIGGVGFYAILFEDPSYGLMVASLFDSPGYCAIYSVDMLANKDVTFGSNSWRGDQYESALRPMVEEWNKKKGSGRIGPFSLPPALKSK